MTVSLQSGRNRRKVLGALAAIALATLWMSPLAIAGGPFASPWSDSSHSGLRLIDGGPTKDGRGVHQAGIALRIKPGFKTYWRHPGDSGVPPVFSFEGSGNLREAVVHFPAPHRFDDGAGGTSFGYLAQELIFPVSVTAMDPGKPVVLKLHADYAVCEKLCVPASANTSLTLSQGGRSPFVEDLRNAMALVPLRVPLGEPGSLRIIGLRRATEPGQLLVEVSVPQGKQPELFVESPSPWFFERKGFAAGDPGKPGIFTIAIVDRPKADPTPDPDIALTLVTPEMAIEVRTRLDAALVKP